MKNKNLIIYLFLAIFIAPNSYAEIAKDKQLHFGVSTVIGGTMQTLTEDPMISMASCLGIGLAKETYDEYSYGGFDNKDLISRCCWLFIGCIWC